MVVNLQNFEIRSVDDALKIIPHIKPCWDLSKVKSKVYNEGITNELIGLWFNNFDDQILVRIYGEKTELFIDRDAERKNFEILQKHGCGPELFATFQNGICYAFIPGKPLELEDVHNEKIWPKICEQMSRLHKIPLTSNEMSPVERLGKFINHIPSEFFDVHKDRLQSYGISKQFLTAEFNELKGVISELNCPIGFVHNDLLLKNIIWNPDKNSVHFIDYEYSGSNYLPFDIANHFCEFVGIDVDLDYDSRYPNLDYQRKWIRTYLSFYLNKTLSQVPFSEVEMWRSWVAKFALASHIFWGSWALLQAHYSNIDFDFICYANLRLQEYRKKKLEFLAN